MIHGFTLFLVNVLLICFIAMCVTLTAGFIQNIIHEDKREKRCEMKERRERARRMK